MSATRTTRSTCIRCGEELVDATRPCGFCREERVRDAVALLVAAASNSSDAALLQRVDAIDTLRSLRYSKEQVLRARAQALDGLSTEEILEGLNQVEAVAA